MNQYVHTAFGYRNASALRFFCRSGNNNKSGRRNCKKTACKINDQKLNTALCKDLAKYTCAHGSYNDGTGTITSGESEVKVEALKNDSKSYFSSEFLKVLKDPKNDYFRKLSLSALGLPTDVDGSKSCPRQTMIAERISISVEKKSALAAAWA